MKIKHAPIHCIFYVFIVISIGSLIYCFSSITNSYWNLLWIIPISAILSIPLSILITLGIGLLIAIISLLLIFFLHIFALTAKILDRKQELFECLGLIMFIGELNDWIFKPNQQRPF